MSKNRRETMYDMEKLVTDGSLKAEQQDKMLQIVMILSKYMFISRSMLDYYAKKSYDGKIGLSYIKRAIKHRLIIEYENENTYFYELAIGGRNLLKTSNKDYKLFDTITLFSTKKKVLAFNYFLLENELEWVNSKANDLENYNYFHCKSNKNIIAYFKDLEILEIDMEENFEFRVIELSDEADIEIKKLTNNLSAITRKNILDEEEAEIYNNKMLFIHLYFYFSCNNLFIKKHNGNVYKEEYLKKFVNEDIYVFHDHRLSPSELDTLNEIKKDFMKKTEKQKLEKMNKLINDYDIVYCKSNSYISFLLMN